MSGTRGQAPEAEVKVRVERTHTMTVRVDSPHIPEQVLRDLLDECPPGVTISVRVIMGGSQREPEPAGYVLTVDLLGGAR